jgi:Transposase, Mutator family
VRARSSWRSRRSAAAAISRASSSRASASSRRWCRSCRGLRGWRLDPQGRSGGRVVRAADLESEVSRICAGLDEQVDAFRNRPLEGRYHYLWLDAKVERIHDGGRVVQKALVLAYALHESGYRELIGLDVALRASSSATRSSGCTGRLHEHVRTARRPTAMDPREATASRRNRLRRRNESDEMSPVATSWSQCRLERMVSGASFVTLARVS